MSPPRERRGLLLGYGLGLAASLLLHGALLGLIPPTPALPSFDVSLRRPMEIELGVVAAPAPEPPPPPKRPVRKRKPAPPPPPEPAVVEAPAPSAPPEESPAPTPESLITADAQAFAEYAPPGAQIALRLDFARIRAAQLAPEVDGLLHALPDWSAIVDGSGLRPVEDLERLYLATPDLQRASVVIAGTYAGDDSLPRRAVDNLAGARGKPAPWTQDTGVDVAPWHSLDPTARVLALVGPREFVITRAEDLSRVLQVLQASARKEGAANVPETEPHIGSLIIEGAQHFVHGHDPRIPIRLQLALAPTAQSTLALSFRGSYANPEAAERAAALWRVAINQLAAHPFVGMLRLREVLLSIEVAVNEDRVEMRAAIDRSRAKMLLSLMRDMLLSSRPPSAQTPASPPL